MDVDDRAAFFIPPNAAFLSQVPQLISDSVADDVSLGPVGNDRHLSEDRKKRCEPCPVELQNAQTEREKSRRGGEKPRGWRLTSSVWWRLVLAKTHRVEESGSPSEVGREAHQSRTNLQERLVTVT